MTLLIFAFFFHAFVCVTRILLDTLWSVQHFTTDRILLCKEFVFLVEYKVLCKSNGSTIKSVNLLLLGKALKLVSCIKSCLGKNESPGCFKTFLRTFWHIKTHNELQWLWLTAASNLFYTVVRTRLWYSQTLCCQSN